MLPLRHALNLSGDRGSLFRDMKNTPLTVAEFCDKHDARDDGRAWAIANCDSMDTAWKTLNHDWLIWVATRPGVLTDRELRLFAVWSARQAQHLMADPRSIAALDVAERHALGNATDEDLDAAWSAAGSAAWSAADAARSAAGSAADAAWSAAMSAAWSEQDKWLRENTNPNFA